MMMISIQMVSYLLLILLANTCIQGAKNPAIFSIADHYKLNPDDPEKFIALTFDDGPHTKLTPKLLDILKAKNCKATFFVMGVKVANRTNIIKRTIQEGHEIGNHVYDHPVISKIPYEELDLQMERTQRAIYAAANFTTVVMRPPYGNTYPKLNQHLASRWNHSVVMWSHDTLDWKFPGAYELVSRAKKKIKSGDIILCHDIFPGTIEAMPSLLDSLLQQGFVFVTVSQLLAKANSGRS